jgi:glyoxylase-like metal-dependent hydrolase (beta-lactamase superfamily II)
MTTLAFDTALDARHGEAVVLAPGLRRVTCNNPGPMTHLGTNTYIVGDGQVAVIDPGPDDRDHLAALLAALRGERVSHIVVTHTHRDHSPLARALAALSGAPIVGCAPHHTPPHAGGEGADHDHAPDRVLADGESLAGQGWTLRALHTPGHTANHLCFAWPEARLLFSGDTVMAWSTTVVSPPDGDMAALFASLRRLGAREEPRFFPGHGPPVADPKAWCAALLAHRQAREDAVLSALGAVPQTAVALVARVYPDVPEKLRGAAARSLLAHLVKLQAERRAREVEGGWVGGQGVPATPPMV